METMADKYFCYTFLKMQIFTSMLMLLWSIFLVHRESEVLELPDKEEVAEAVDLRLPGHRVNVLQEN